MYVQVSSQELSSLLSRHCTIENDVAFSAHSLKSNVSNPFATTGTLIVVSMDAGHLWITSSSTIERKGDAVCHWTTRGFVLYGYVYISG
ncbi:hypothetical protein BRADI_2g13645v3 [Brachypodium distachyon]|nr:hypothetical protein BRADI_2g13645v3 [Brachypodium distachyon]PNT70570.1 hypothetical protein BRADI_2g13645v3 [Brachypodium distachyon]PNT70571.1 hypothetical protein BRADI_2g13645v3 [Brachypodium distachyon]